MVATLTKIIEAAASFLSLQCVCVKTGVYCSWTRLFQGKGPFQSSSLHRPFHRSLIHIHRRLALLAYQRPASCDRRLAPPIARLPLWEYSHLSSPSPHPVQWLLFFTLTQWLEKKRGRGEGGGGEGESQLPLAESCRWRLRIDRLPRKRLPSERRQWQPAIDEGGGWRTK